MSNLNTQNTFQVQMIVTRVNRVTRNNNEVYQSCILNDGFISFTSASHLLNDRADHYARAQRINNLTRSFYLVDPTGNRVLIRTVSF